MSKKFLCTCGKIRTQDYCPSCGETKKDFRERKAFVKGKPKNNNIVITGEPNSGKSTHAFSIVGDGFVYDMDKICEAMNPAYATYESRKDDVLEVARSVRDCLVEQSIKNHRRFVFIVTNHIAAKRIARSCNGKLVEMVKGVAKQVRQNTIAKQDNKDSRPSAASRGYDYRWSQFSKWFRTQYPLCADCLEAGKVHPCSEVHHKIKLSERPDLKYEVSNLMALCGPCHKIRTARGE
jgi:5-methylcytosine-specific restriction protein A